MPSADFCSAIRPPHGALSRRSDTEQISWSKFSRLPYTVAGSTLRILDGCGISLDGTRWISCRPGFFLPVRVLSRLFRRLFLDRLLAAHTAGRLKFFGAHAALADPQVFTTYLAPSRKAEWVVYAKKPFGGPQAVLAYLSRYTHRVAIANSRL